MKRNNPIIPGDIFSDRRVLVDRRVATKAKKTYDEELCIRKNQRRVSNKFHKRDWWLHADYVDYEEQV